MRGRGGVEEELRREEGRVEVGSEGKGMGLRRS